MTPLFIYSYKSGSKSVKALKQGLQAKVINLQHSNFKGKGKIVLNWGNSNINDEVLKATVINSPEAIAVAANKKSFFEVVHNQVPVPEFTNDVEVANEWMVKGKAIIVREKLTGSGGEGIVLMDNIEQWENYDKNRGKLFVLYIPKKDEYRVHVMGGKVIDVQKKAIKKDTPNHKINWQIRNHTNGFIFKREGVNPPEQVLNISIDAVKLVGLDFGAVDVIWNNYREKGYVLEVNTAPGLEGQTVESYINGLSELYNSILNKPMKVLNSGLKSYGSPEFKGVKLKFEEPPIKVLNEVFEDGALF